MDLSLLQNFQTLVSTSLQSIVDDLKVQYENMRDDLQDRITVLEEENEKAKKNIEKLNKKLEESNFSEDNFNRVSIISNLNKQIKELRNENSDLRNCLSKNFPMNQSLARASISDEVASLGEDEVSNEVEQQVNEVEEVIKELKVEEEISELEEIVYKEKTYYLVDSELFTKKKNGKQGKCVGKIVNGKPKLNKKTSFLSQSKI